MGLQINPDSAKGYKARGIARAMFGEWAEAEKDLHLASMIDYDAEISDVLKEVYHGFIHKFNPPFLCIDIALELIKLHFS